MLQGPPGALLLDFDGPVCSVFAGYPAARVAAELVALLETEGVAVPMRVRGEPDPLGVLRWAGEHCPHPVLAATEDALRAAEIGYANKPWKVDALAAADDVLTSLRELLPASTSPATARVCPTRWGSAR